MSELSLAQKGKNTTNVAILVRILTKPVRIPFAGRFRGQGPILPWNRLREPV